MIVKFLLFSIINFLLMLLAYPIVPIAVLFANKETGRLPKIFRWFETHDDLGWGAGTYEEPIGKAFEKHGKRVALILWLWRNKAYTFRNKIRIKFNEKQFYVNKYGSDVPPKFGPYFSNYILTTDGKKYFDLFLGFSFVKFHLYFRMGWKLKPIAFGQIPTETSATGMFSGISIRSDDWDDYQ